MKDLWIGWLAAISAVAIFLFAKYDEQHSPHRVRSTYCGKVLADFTATNPEYVTLKWEHKLTSNGMEQVAVPVTNYYWKVWSIFR